MIGTYYKEIKHLDESGEILKMPIKWEEKGIEKGKMEEKRENVLAMLEEGLSIDLIARVTQLDKKEIENIKENLKS